MKLNCTHFPGFMGYLLTQAPTLSFNNIYLYLKMTWMPLTYPNLIRALSYLRIHLLAKPCGGLQLLIKY
jgi:hypothetical protein